jgi:hypothetical protein
MAMGADAPRPLQLEGVGRPDIPTLRRWADLTAFCLDASGDELVDALIMLAEGLEAALEAALATGETPR